MTIFYLLLVAPFTVLSAKALSTLYPKGWAHMVVSNKTASSSKLGSLSLPPLIHSDGQKNVVFTFIIVLFDFGCVLSYKYDLE